MRVGVALGSGALEEVPEAAARAEALGFDFLSSSETSHNPFLPLALAAEHTRKIELRTSIALAFARSPTDVAYIAWDLQALSGGRLALGLGSQVRGHIVRRFGMSWTPPVPRMREYILALRAIWDSWQDGGPLDFDGDHYRLNLMPPVFSPGPIEHPRIRVNISAVNPRMLRLAGELCDGVLLHTFNTSKYTSEVVLPNLAEGAPKTGRTLNDFDLSGGGLVVTGPTDEDVESQLPAARSRIAFYASTRSYAPVMTVHGWQGTAEKLYRMSVEGRWSEMGTEITDEMLNEFAVVGKYADLGPKLKDRFGSYATSVTLALPGGGEGRGRAHGKPGTDSTTV